MAASLATGREMLYKRAGDPVTVMYVDSEMTEDDLAERLTDMGFDYETDELLQQNLRYYLHPDINPIDTPAGATALVGIAMRDQALIVFIDTVTSQTAGGENDADTFRALGCLRSCSENRPGTLLLVGISVGVMAVLLSIGVRGTSRRTSLTALDLVDLTSTNVMRSMYLSTLSTSRRSVIPEVSMTRSKDRALHVPPSSRSNSRMRFFVFLSGF
jgi:hypothetical protein